MSDTERDGGPAFPVMEQVERYRDERYVTEWHPVGGMTLRDHFAGLVLGPLIYERFSSEREWSDEEMARWSYETADAMLAERKKEPKP